MTLADMKELVLLQLGEDPEDVDEYADLLNFYLEKGYRELMRVRKRGLMDDVEPLSDDDNLLPDEYHGALVDYATYGILANGNASKQQRSQMFLMRFEDVRMRIRSERDEEAHAANEGNWKFTGLYDR
jgi:hypothetical protein